MDYPTLEKKIFLAVEELFKKVDGIYFNRSSKKLSLIGAYKLGCHYWDKAWYLSYIIEDYMLEHLRDDKKKYLIEPKTASYYEVALNLTINIRRFAKGLIKPKKDESYQEYKARILN